MPSGSCFCGKCKYNFTGEVEATALCHCYDCRKISGSAYSTNILVPREGFTTTGTTKALNKTADNGNQIVSYFCPECGSTLWADGATWPDSLVIKVGTLDSEEALENWKPAFELYAPHRPSWISTVQGTEQKEAMLDSDSVN